MRTHHWHPLHVSCVLGRLACAVAGIWKTCSQQRARCTWRCLLLTTCYPGIGSRAFASVHRGGHRAQNRRLCLLWCVSARAIDPCRGECHFMLKSVGSCRAFPQASADLSLLMSLLMSVPCSSHPLRLSRMLRDLPSRSAAAAGGAPLPPQAAAAAPTGYIANTFAQERIAAQVSALSCTGPCLKEARLALWGVSRSQREGA